MPRRWLRSASTTSWDRSPGGGRRRWNPIRASCCRRSGSRASQVRDLRYGENPHQEAAWYAEADGRTGFGAATVHQGKELSFTNLLDLDAASRIALEFDEPVAVVIKHTNPCGVATAETLAEAYVRARDADPLSAFGGIVGLNRPIDLDTARALTSTFIEAVVAPGLTDPEAVLAFWAPRATCAW